MVAFAPPAALELGNATGFDFELEDRGNIGHAALMQARGQLLGMASKDPAIGMIRPNGLDDEPQYKLDIDREKASALGLSIGNINDALGAGWGSAYVNQFVDRNRVKRVFMQGDADSRMLPQDLDLWYVRNGAGQMVPFSAFASAHWIVGSPKLERYNGTPSLEFLGAPAPGKSTGRCASPRWRQLVTKLPPGRGLRVDRPLLRGAALGLAGAGALRHLAHRRVPVPGGAVRELVDPVRGDAGRAARHHRRHRRHALPRTRLTTSSSRWACSPRWVCRPRTPS